MKHSDFKMGMEFTTAEGSKLWRVTDVGSRTIIAIMIDGSEGEGIKSFMINRTTKKVTERIMSRAESESAGWFNGPPYAVAEHVFDEDGIEGCEPV